jgi:adenosylhomocysteine nucleosidase
MNMVNGKNRIQSRMTLLVLIVQVIAGSGMALADDNPVSIEPTAILGAMPVEIESLRKNLSEGKNQEVLGLTFHTGKMNGRDVVLCRCGVGKVNAAMMTAILVDRFHPRELLFTGIAGGLNPNLRPGDIVIGEKTVQHDFGFLETNGFRTTTPRNPINLKRNPLYLPADEKLLRLAEDVAKTIPLEEVSIDGKKQTPRIVRGIIASGDVFVASTKANREIRTRLNADAVEMEGAAVAQVCCQFKVPCLVIRSLSDHAKEKAEKELETFAQTAANNSANFVLALVKKLAAEKQGQKE